MDGGTEVILKVDSLARCLANPWDLLQRIFWSRPLWMESTLDEG